MKPSWSKQDQPGALLLRQKTLEVKLVGVPEIKPRENASETSQLRLNIFNAIGAEIYPYDIDLAHRVTPRQAAEGRPKPIV